MANKKQPEIRFPGFTDEWVEYQLKDVGEIVTGNTPSTKNLDNYTGNFLFVSPIDIQQNRFVKQTVTRISKRGFNAGRFVRKGSILFVSIGSTIGKVGQASKNLITNQQINSVIPNNNHQDDFIYSLLVKKSPQIRQLASTQAVPIINKSDFSNIYIFIPILIEQIKIGNFFKKLDEAITLQERELDLLKEQKKGFLQKMFPKEGATIPELRFPGYTDAWEERKLGDVVRFINGRSYKQKELLHDGKYRVLRVGNFNTNDFWYFSNLELEDDKYANKGDLLYLWATNFGPEIWNGEKIIYHYHIWKLDIEEKKLDKNYLYVWLFNDKERIKHTTNGTTMVHVTKGGMEERLFQIPKSFKEQTQIGNFFKQLDENITLQTQKLAQLKELKKGFLQKMFV